MVEIRNFTPHSLTVLDAAGVPVSFPSLGVARCSQSVEVVGLVDASSTSFSISRQVISSVVTGLPEVQDGVRFVVSRLVAEALRGQRDDLLIPGTLIRDDQGKVVGCQGFSVL